jgi:predicted permease
MPRDIRYCFRTLWKNPGLMAVAIVSLGLGIGVNLTVFGVFESMFLAGVTASDPGRTFHVWVGGGNRTSYPNFRDLRESKAVAELAGYDVMEFSTGTGEQQNKEFGQAVTGRYFEMLGIQPATGRLFTGDEQKPERNAQVAIVSDSYWHRQYSADPKVLGETIHLNGKPYTIVGVLPKSYRSIHGMGIEPPIYVPYSNALKGDVNDRAAHSLELLMKVAPGVSRQQASAALLSVAEVLERSYPDADKEFSRIRSYAIQGPEFIQREGGSMMMVVFFTILMVIVGLILLIACANVAGLLVARAVNKRKEIAVRLAIGASRGRIIRLFLTESVVLTTLGAGAAALFNAWAVQGLARIRLPIEIPIEFRVEPNWHVLLYALLIAAATALMCGIGPGLEAARANVSAGLKNETGTPGRYRLFTLRNSLVIGQVSVSLLLLVISLLFVRSLQKVQTVDPGFNVANQLIATISLDNPQAEREKSRRLTDEVIDSLARTPGVRSASGGLMVPLTRNTWTSEVFPNNDQTRPRLVQGNAVAPRYFETMGIAIVRGREIQKTDIAEAPRVAVVNQALAQQLFAGQNVLGRTLGIPGQAGAYEIVGVAADSKYESLGEGPTPIVYLPYKQADLPFSLRLHIRTEGPAAAMTAAVRSAIRQLEPSASVEVKTMREITAFSTVPNKVGAAILGAMGALGLILASIGLYGVLAYAVSQRTREIGIRMALGASRSQVLQIILGEAMALVGIGVAIGLILALAATRPLSSFLSAGVSVTDPVTIAMVVLVLGVTGAGAAFVPARRALGVDPMTALRYD